MLWWEGTAGIALGAIISAAITFWWASWRRSTERRGEVTAMAVEMYHARRLIGALAADHISAPLYRLPMDMFERHLPKLVGDGVLTDNEVAALVEYVMRAEELNRGFERASAAAAMNDSVAIQQEYARNCTKAQRIMAAPPEGRSIFEAAETALLRLSTRRRLCGWRRDG
jgi:hypothetical protein